MTFQTPFKLSKTTLMLIPNTGQIQFFVRDLTSLGIRKMEDVP